MEAAAGAPLLPQGAAFCSAIRDLQSGVGGLIDTLARSQAKDRSQLNADITRGMTELRAKHRELEAVAEELDR